VAVFTAALVHITSGGIYRHFSPVMVGAAVFTAAVDLAKEKIDRSQLQ